MPVTKTARRALRSSTKKAEVNNKFRKSLEITLRIAKKDMSKKAVLTAISLADRASKRGLIHKNKAARIKSSLNKISADKEQKTVKKK